MSENIRLYSQGQPVVVTDRNFRGKFRVGVVIGYSSIHDEYRITFSEDSTRWYRNDVITGAISLPIGATVLHTQYGSGQIIQHSVNSIGDIYIIKFNGRSVTLPITTVFDSVSIQTASASNARLDVGDLVAINDTLEIGTIKRIDPWDSDNGYTVVFDSPSATRITKYLHSKKILLVKKTTKEAINSNSSENEPADVTMSVGELILDGRLSVDGVETPFAERILAEMVAEEDRIWTEIGKLQANLVLLRGAKEKIVDMLTDI